MIAFPRRRHAHVGDLQTWLVLGLVLFAAAWLGAQASARWVVLLGLGMAVPALLRWPILGLFAVILAALVVPREFGTGTEVNLNPVTLLLPALLLVWILSMVLRRDLRLAPSRTTRPLLLFLAAGLLSLLVGNATWDPQIPKSSHFLLVQLAQWGMFALSAGAFLLMARQVRDEVWLQRLVFALLLVGGGLAIASALAGARTLVGSVATVALIRTPFWALLAALAGGQLLFNHKLRPGWRLLAACILPATLVYALVQEQDAASNWVGIAAVAGALIWLRWPRLRWPIVIFIAILIAIDLLFPSVYEFAGGDQEWVLSGGSRLALIERVVDVSLRNPITGLGPASYRPYANMEPLYYRGAYWIAPSINSHNNYVDIFAHTGLLGLGLFLWFMAEVARLGWRLGRRFQQGFAAGYVNGMLAAWAGIMVVMMLLDWFLPFVYNVGFPGFQASVLVWMFLGGLVALDNFQVEVEVEGRTDA